MDQPTRERERASRAEQFPNTSSGWDLGPDLETLQSNLQELLQRSFEPTDVKLETKTVWKRVSPPDEDQEEFELEREERAEIRVRIRRIESTQEHCFVALGFDTPVQTFECKEIDFKGDAHGDQSFTPPPDWLMDEGPRWVIVCITTRMIEKDELAKQRNPTFPTKSIVFSLHPWAVPGPKPRRKNDSSRGTARKYDAARRAE